MVPLAQKLFFNCLQSSHYVGNNLLFMYQLVFAIYTNTLMYYFWIGLFY